MNRRNRRGFTLTELVIVLAVLAIVSTMVISFTAMVTNSRQLSSARLDALGDVRVAETVIESFIEKNAGAAVSDDKLSITANEKSISFIKGEEELGGNLVINSATEGEDPETSVALERVTNITFDEYGDNTDKIYYCTIKYKVGNHVFDYTFCVNPYVGESVGG